MKLSKYILIISAVSFVLYGCQKEETGKGENETPVVTEPVALLLNASGILENSSEKLETEANDETKSRVSGTTWEISDKIGVFMLDDGSFNVHNNYSNISYSFDDNKVQFVSVSIDGKDNTIYFPADGSFKDIVAYYPYAELTEGSFGINISDQSNQSVLDVMRGYQEKLAYNNVTPEVNMMFRHKMSRIKINFIPGDGITQDDLKRTKVYITGFKASGTYNPVLDKVVVGNEIYNGNITLPLSTDALSAQGIVLPELSSEGRKLYIAPIYKDNPYVYEISNELSFAEGKTYIFDVNIYRDKVVVIPSVEDWWDSEEEDIELIYDENNI